MLRELIETMPQSQPLGGFHCNVDGFLPGQSFVISFVEVKDCAQHPCVAPMQVFPKRFIDFL